MLKALTALMLTSTMAAHACPNLAGKYSTCADPTGQMTSSGVEIIQKVENRTMVYYITDSDEIEKVTSTYRADGKTYIQTENNPEIGTIRSATTVSCVGNASIRMKLNVKIENQIVTDMVTEISKSNNKLIMVTKGLAFGEQIDQTETCQ
jgi:hypothetical protein